MSKNGVTTFCYLCFKKLDDEEDVVSKMQRKLIVVCRECYQKDDFNNKCNCVKPKLADVRAVVNRYLGGYKTVHVGYEFDVLSRKFISKEDIEDMIKAICNLF